MRHKMVWGVSVVIGSILVIVLIIFGVLRSHPAHYEMHEHLGPEVHEHAVEAVPTHEPPHEGEEISLSGALVDGVRVIKMKARQFEFVPSKVVVKEGEKVRLEVTSEDVTHGIAIQNYGINRTLEPSKTEIITFTADKLGSHHFHCSVYCGQGHNDMHGEVIVITHSE